MTPDGLGPTSLFTRLVDAPRRDLAQAMRQGSRPDVATLAGWEYRGVNTAWWARRVGMDRFVKGFVERAGAEPGVDDEPRLRGYNRPVDRRLPPKTWLPDNEQAPAPFAPFAVSDVDPEATDNRYLQALLLDYGAVHGRRWDPTRSIRDYLVVIESNRDDVLLGHAFVAVGRQRVPVTYFVLERLRPVPEGTDPPGGA